MTAVRTLSAALLLAAHSLAAQTAPSVVIPDAPSCPRCTIVLRTIATLGTADGPGQIITTPNGVAVDGRGRYWITQEGELPFVYDATGRFIQVVGAKGGGPGEFEYAYAPTPISGDSVLVLDNARITVVAPDLRPVRTIRTTEPPGRLTVVQWPALAIGTRARYGRDMTLGPLFRMSLTTGESNVLTTFGPDRGDLDPRYPLRQVIGAGTSAGRIWAADAGNRRYRVAQWNVDGSLMRSFERKPDWFVNVQPPGPTPGVADISEAADGTLLVYVNVRAPTWREAFPPATGTGPRDIPARQIAMEKMFRTTIEAIDPAGARVIAHLDHHEWVFAALPSNRAAIYTVDDNGIARVRIVEVVLQR